MTENKHATDGRITHDQPTPDDSITHDRPPASEQVATTSSVPEQATTLSPESEQTDAPSPTRINGMPVWKLDGVKLTNRNLVLISDAWIHLSDLGDEGWGLMAPRAQIETWKDDLAKEGITISPWVDMPYKPYGWGFLCGAKLMLFLSFLMIFLWFPVGPLAFFVTLIAVLIIHGLNRYDCRNLRIANSLKPLFSHTSIRESHVAPNTTVSSTRYYD